MLAAVRRSPDDGTSTTPIPDALLKSEMDFSRALRKPLCFYSARVPRLVGYVAGSGQIVDLPRGHFSPDL